MVTVLSIPAGTKDGNYCSNLQEFLDCASLLSIPLDYWILSNSNQWESETVILCNQKGITRFR